MHKVDTSRILHDINGAPIRRVAVDWRDTLRTVGTLAEKNPGAPIGRLLDAAAATIASAEGSALTLAAAAIEALIGSKGAEGCSGAEKLQRWQLAQRFSAGGVLELRSEDVLFVQQCLADTFRAAVYGPAYDALNTTA